MYREMSWILPNITNVISLLKYWSYGEKKQNKKKLKIIINIIFIEPMYLLLDHIKGKNYLLYKIKEEKRKKKSFI